MENFTVMESKTPILSIIIPFYNLAEYTVLLIKNLEKQINNQQTFIEIIVVNDGSDNSELLALKKVSSSSFIKVINIINSGLSVARNTGLKYARGKYIWFIDSDDNIAINGLEYILPLLNKNIDLLTFNYNNDVENLLIMSKNPITINRNVYCDLIYGNMKHYAWNYIVKKNIFLTSIGNFPINRLYEDTATTYKLYMMIKNAVYINLPIYRYRIRENSTVANVKAQDFYDLKKTINELNKQITDVPELVYYRMIVVAIAIQLGRAASGINKSDIESLYRYVKISYVLKKPTIGMIRRYLYVKIPFSSLLVSKIIGLRHKRYKS